MSEGSAPAGGGAPSGSSAPASSPSGGDTGSSVQIPPNSFAGSEEGTLHRDTHLDPHKSKAPTKKPPAEKVSDDPPLPSDLDAATKATQEQIRKYKIKANGQDVELDEAEMLKKAELGYGAYTKFEEAAKLRKDVQTFVKALRSDDPQTRAQALEAAGFNVQEYVDQHIEQLRAEAQLTPDQRERKRIEGQLQQREEQIAKREAHYRETHIAQQTKVVQQQYQEMFGKALGEAGVPDTGMQMVRIAKTVQTLQKAGYDISPATVAHAAGIVAQEYRSEAESYVSGLEVPRLLELLGRDKVSAIRKHFVDQARSAEAAKVAPAPTPRSDDRKPDAPRVTTEELLRKAQERRFG